MKSLLITLLLFTTSFAYSQDLYNSFYSHFHFGGQIENPGYNMLQVYKNRAEYDNYYSVRFVHRSNSEKWEIAGDFRRNERSTVAIDGLVRRRLIYRDGRKLYASFTLLHEVINSDNQFNKFNDLKPGFGLNYVGKMVETGFMYRKMVAYSKNVNKTWNDYRGGLWLYVGIKNDTKLGVLKSRLSGDFINDNTPIFSQQLYHPSKINLGYGLGLDKTFSINIGYRFKQLEGNITFGNDNQRVIFTGKQKALKFGVIAHL